MNCLNCGINIEFNNEKKDNKYYVASYKRMKFCSKECRIEHYGLPINYHEAAIKQIKLLFPNTIISQGAYNRGGYTPDLYDNNNNYEVELFAKLQHLKNKIINKKDANNNKNNILIIVAHPEVLKMFDECYFLKNNKLIHL